MAVSRIPKSSVPLEVRRAFQHRDVGAQLLFEGTAGQVLVGVAAGTIAAWTTELTGITLLTVDNITVDGATIVSDTGAIGFGDDNLSTTGSIAASSAVIGNVTISTATITSDTGAISFGNENLSTTGTVVGSNIPSPSAQYQVLQADSAGNASWTLAPTGITSLGVDYIDMTPGLADPAHSEGRLFYDDTNKTLAVYNNEADVALQLGQEIYIRATNKTGATITNGSLVYITGAQGQRPTIALAKADAVSTAKLVAVATHDIDDNATGFCTSLGTVGGLNTSTWSEGTMLYLSDSTAGAATDTPPTAPSFVIKVGEVIYQNVSEGKVHVHIGHDVTGTLVIHDLDVNTNLDVGGDVTFVDATTTGKIDGVDLDVMNRFFNGTFQETFNALVTSDGATVSLSLEQSGGGDLTMQFSDGYTTLDCTPADTVALSAGTDASPQGNFTYVLQSNKTLTNSTSGWPASEHIKVSYTLVPSAAFVQSDGCYVNQNWNDHLSGTDAQGHMSHMAEKVRLMGASWYSGIGPNGATTSYYTISAGNTEWLSNVGVVLQMHEQAFPAFDTTSGSKLLAVNDNAAAYTAITDLFSITDDSTGTTITNNRYFSLVFWGVANKGGEFSAIMVNLPSGFYALQSDAEIDADGYDTYEIPREFNIDSGTAFLIARSVFQMGSTWSHISTTDLRGKSPANFTGSSVNDHGSLGGLGDDDHTQYLLADGTRDLTGNMAVDALITIDGRDLSVDGTKLDGVEALADVTDATNVAAAGAAMAGGAFHDGFSDFSSDEHVAHSGVTITAGSGLTGGGTIASTRTINLDLSSLAKVSIATNDRIPFWDADGGINAYALFSEIESSLSHDSIGSGTIADHDTNATGAQLNTLTDDSMSDSLHRHSELSASDGTPNAVLSIDAGGNVIIDNGYKIGVGTLAPDGPVHIAVVDVSISSALDDPYVGAGLTNDLYITNNNTAQVAFMCASSTASRGMALTGRKCAGTLTSPSAVANNHQLLILLGEGFDGTKMLGQTADIGLYVDGSVSTDTIPGRVQVRTSETDQTGMVIRQVWKSDGKVGINSGAGNTAPDCRFEVETETDEGTQAVTIDQNDSDQAFIDYQGTSAANASNSISSWTNGATAQGHIRIEINGTTYWMPYYDAPTS